MNDQLKAIGFYTLNDERALNSSVTSPLWRAELILTDKCNFKCPYCRGIKKEYAGELPTEEAHATVDLWLKDNLKNVRFSGGEPMLYKDLPALVAKCKAGGVEHIAVSTNGSLPTKFYEGLIAKGVNDFSISLDACCASAGDKMAGGVSGSWEKVVANIKHLSKLVYVTVGVVLTEENAPEIKSIVSFAHDLGVADIRIIPAAQWTEKLMDSVKEISQHILDAHPILSYRVKNLLKGRAVRGVTETDEHSCPLVLDDMAAVGWYHFPCIIYLREGGKPIGKVGPAMRQDREAWSETHNAFHDPICKKNCLDVCVDYNNRCRKLRSERE